MLNFSVPLFYLWDKKHTVAMGPTLVLPTHLCFGIELVDRRIIKKACYAGINRCSRPIK